MALQLGASTGDLQKNFSRKNYFTVVNIMAMKLTTRMAMVTIVITITITIAITITITIINNYSTNARWI